MLEFEKVSKENFAVLSRGMFANTRQPLSLHIQRFIYNVKRGDLEEVEKILRVFPEFVQMQRVIGTLWCHEMGNVEARGFQGGRMAGDFSYCPEQTGLVELILRYIPRAVSAEHLKEFETLESVIFKHYGALLEVDENDVLHAVYFSVDETLEAFGAVIEQHEASGDYDKAKQDRVKFLWSVGVSSAEKEWPDWLKEVFSEERKDGWEDTAWMTKDITRKVKREMRCLAD
jgi:hypothetical protein